MKHKTAILIILLLIPLAFFACTVPNNQTKEVPDGVRDGQTTDAPNGQASATQDVQSVGINLTEIQVGNYSSLQGVWTEVCYAVNYYDSDNPGVHWKAGAPAHDADTLSVSSDKIVFNETVVIQGNTLTDDAGSHPLSFENSGNSLVASIPDDHIFAINWAVWFYPNGATNDFQPNNGVKIDNTKNLIVIWTSNMCYYAVFAQTETKL